MDKNKTNRRRFYIDVSTSDSPKWAKVGRGFIKFREKMSPRLYKRHYITDPTDTVTVLGYTPEIEFELDTRFSDPSCSRLREIACGECVGEGAALSVLSVDACDAVSEIGYPACRRRYTVTQGEYCTDLATYKGILEADPKLERGTFYPSSVVFLKETDHSSEVGV